MSGTSGAAGLPLEATNLAFRYPSGRVGVMSLTLAVRPGERVCVLGPNGSGKSTLHRLAAGILDPAEGSLAVLGHEPRHAPPGLRRRVGVAGDRPVHYEPLTTSANARLFARAAGLSTERSRERLGPLFDAFALDADMPVADCSLGMRRKLLLVEALAHDPELLLLDEPTLGLDPPGRDALLEQLGRRGEDGCAALVATNDVAFAERAGSRVVFLDGGRVLTEGEPGTLLERHGGATRVEIELEGDAASGRALAGEFHPGPGARCTWYGPALVVETERGVRAVPDLVERLLVAGLRPRSLRVREPNLSDVFRALSGRAMGEET